jgi:hypothetical protein
MYQRWRFWRGDSGGGDDGAAVVTIVLAVL